MVRAVVGHILGQGCGQAVRHGVADVVVGAVLPVAGLARGVVGVLDLLLELGHVGLAVRERGGRDLGYDLVGLLELVGVVVAYRDRHRDAVLGEQEDALRVLVGVFGHGVGPG